MGLNLAFLGYFFLVIAVYVITFNLYIVLTQYRKVKFSWNYGCFFLPILPLIGQYYVALFSGEKFNILGTYDWVAKHFGMPFNSWYGRHYMYISNSAEEARIILNHPKCLNKAVLYEKLSYLFADSILLIEGEKWKPRRRHLRSAFNTKNLTALIPKVREISDILIERINSMKADTFAALTGENSLDKDDPIIVLIDKIQYEFNNLMFNPIVPVSFWVQSPFGANLKRLLETLKDFYRVKFELITEKQRNNLENSAEALTDLLIAPEYRKKSNEDIYNEFFLFLTAGVDTTGHLLVFCFALMGMFPDVQKLVYEEVMSIIGNEAIDHEHLSKLEYMEAVICETTRLFPIVPFVGRYLNDDIVVGTKVFPKGVNYYASIFHIHRNPEYWPEPLKFDPGRFLPENASKIVPGSFLPFSGGPRNCIGKNLALMGTKITIAHVIRNFKIESNHKDINEFHLESCISMKAKNNVDCRFVPRTEN